VSNTSHPFIKHEDPSTVRKVIAKLSERTCPGCGETYIIGKTGVVEGCDDCLNIERDRAGMIIGQYQEADHE
jgi:pyruvate/2-oxoacid:ferredoxin oxidoreductase beta subunit